MIRPWIPAAWLGLAVALAACDGGDASDTSDPSGVPGATDGDDPVVYPDGDVTLSVQATYARPPITAWDGLDYTAVQTLPIRRADLWAADAATGELLDEAVLDGTGTAELVVPPAVDITVGIAAHVADYDLSVLDNTRDDALWTLLHEVDAPADTPAPVTIHAGLEHDGTRYLSRASAPFAILDTALIASEAVDAVTDTPFVPLDIHWSADNIPSGGSKATGRIGTSHHSWGDGIYILGAEDVDTDEYDEAVVTHEWFHYHERAFSRSESTGGSHGDDAVLHMSLAWSEGAVTALGNHTLGHPHYRDSNDPAQADSWQDHLEDNREGGAVGFYGSASASSILWDVLDDAADEDDAIALSFGAVHEVLEGPFRDTPALTSLFAFGDALLQHHPELASDVTALYAREDIVAPLDPWGTGETNDGGDPGSVDPALYRPLAVGDAVVLTDFGPATNPGNRLSDYRFYRHTALADGEVEARTDASDDVDLKVYHRGERLCRSAGSDGDETCAFEVEAGEDYVIEIDGSYLDEVVDVDVSLVELP